MKTLDWILFFVLCVLLFQWCTQKNVLEKDIIETSIDFINEYVEYADSVSNIKQ
jgi:hypothetical protein